MIFSVFCSHIPRILLSFPYILPFGEKSNSQHKDSGLADSTGSQNLLCLCAQRTGDNGLTKKGTFRHGMGQSYSSFLSLEVEPTRNHVLYCPLSICNVLSHVWFRSQSQIQVRCRERGTLLLWLSPFSHFSLYCQQHWLPQTLSPCSSHQKTTGFLLEC